MLENKKKCYFCNSCEKKLRGLTINYCETCYEKETAIFEEIIKCEGIPSIDKINENIYLGNLYGALEKDELKSYGVTHILVCGLGLPIMYPQDFIYKKLDLLDEEDENLFIYLQEALDFINNSNIIYIHCQVGVSRSASILIAYLMWKNKLSYDQVKSIVKKQRNVIHPKKNFEMQLRQFEKDDYIIKY